ncbi:cobalamin-binding protein [Bacillus sp. 165]|uniref:cobalamin-binding protein n=1 Tax=Bacillus sp. 165 TaxID=1529117 RepID=UPI001ADD5446|nr:cobalamin-binding protein [Bacillus sp. 165]MBO9129235.1 cobalamin-binding protein [Bacillus sp. 165]
MRIVSICPSNTELIAYLGCIDQLVGVDDYSDWPEEINRLPRLGPDLSINMDLVEQLHPDLVVASLSVPGMEKNIAELEKRRLPYIVLNPNSLQDIADDLVTLSKALKREKKGKEVAKQYSAFIEQYKTIARSISTKPTLYWEWWPKPVFAPGKLNWLTEISRLAGGRNIFSDIETANVQSNWEEVKQRNPEHICLAWVGVQTKKVNPATLVKRPDWPDMHAIKTNQIYVLEEWLYCRPSPRLLVGLKKVAALIHPDHYPAYDGKDPLL